MWTKEAVHAADWSYAMVTAACPNETSGLAVFNADAWSPGTNGTRWDMGFAKQWIDQVFGDGMTKNATYCNCFFLPMKPTNFFSELFLLMEYLRHFKNCWILQNIFILVTVLLTGKMAHWFVMNNSEVYTR